MSAIKKIYYCIKVSLFYHRSKIRENNYIQRYVMFFTIVYKIFQVIKISIN